MGVWGKSIVVLVAMLIGWTGLPNRAMADSGERIVRIEVVGNRLMSQEKVGDLLGWVRKEEWVQGGEEEAVKGLLLEYARRGYPEASITVRTDQEEGGGIAVSVSIVEGAYLPLVVLEIEGASSISEADIRDGMETRTGRHLEPESLIRDLDRLLGIYARTGHPFSRVLVTGISREQEPEGFRLSLHIVEGPPLTMGGLRVTGNRSTRRRTVERLAGLRMGELYDQSAVDAVPERLLRSGLFRKVLPPLTSIDWKEKRAVVQLEVEEAQANRVVGVIGFAPGPDGEDPVISGFFDVSFPNILGTARRGEAHWERISPETRSTSVSYREPWVFGTPFGIGVAGEQELRDSTYRRAAASGTIDLDLSRRVTASFLIGTETMRPRGDRSLVPRSGKTWGTMGIVYDGRDRPGNPSAGLYFRFAPGYAERDIEGDEERGIRKERIRQSTIDAGFGVYRRVSRNSVLAFELNTLVRFSDASFIPDYDQFYLGGAHTLRGYDEDRFRGSRIGWSRFELRYLLGVQSRVFLFHDSGYIFARIPEAETLRTKETWKNGFGVGLRIETAAGLLGIDYGLGEGDSFQEGKIHVSAGGAF